MRGWFRATYDLRMWRPRLTASYYDVAHQAKAISSREHDLYWSSDRGLGRERLLDSIVKEAKRLRWLGVFNNAWATWDVKLVGDLWHTLLLHTVTEELGGNKRFTRARLTAKPTVLNRVVSIASLIWTAAALLTVQPLALGLALLGSAAALMQNISSRRGCLQAAASLVAHAGKDAELDPVDKSGRLAERPSYSTPPSENAQVRLPTPVAT
jgi:hypothetical protein